MTAKRAYAYWRDPQTTAETWEEYENVEDKWCPPTRLVGRYGDSWFASLDEDVLREFLHPRMVQGYSDPHPIEVSPQAFEERWREAEAADAAMDWNVWRTSIEQPVPRSACPCCGFRTLSEPVGSFDICSVCEWEADNLQSFKPDFKPGPNEECLAASRLTFLRVWRAGATPTAPYRRLPSTGECPVPPPPREQLVREEVDERVRRMRAEVDRLWEDEKPIFERWTRATIIYRYGGDSPETQEALAGLEKHQEERRQFARERAEMRRRYGMLFDRLRVLLCHHDPVNIGVPQDWPAHWTAFDTQAEALVAPIDAAQDAETFRHALHQEFLHSFLPEVAGPEERYEPLARNIWAIREQGGEASV